MVQQDVPDGTNIGSEKIGSMLKALYNIELTGNTCIGTIFVNNNSRINME